MRVESKSYLITTDNEFTNLRPFNFYIPKDSLSNVFSLISDTILIKRQPVRVVTHVLPLKPIYVSNTKGVPPYLASIYLFCEGPDQPVIIGLNEIEEPSFTTFLPNGSFFTLKEPTH
jgi:hypothetical protein